MQIWREKKKQDIEYLRKILQEVNISNSLIRTRTWSYNEFRNFWGEIFCK